MEIDYKAFFRLCLEHRKMSFALTAVCLFLFTMWLSKTYIYNEMEPVAKTDSVKVAFKRRYAERMLESKDVCFDMHIFVREVSGRRLEMPVKITDVIIIESVLDKEADDKQDRVIHLRKHGLNETSLIYVMVGILIISTIVSLADVLKEKRAQKSGNSSPDSDINERCSLAEFANMKRSRRESTIMGGGATSSARESGGKAPLCRFESVGTAFSRMRRESAAVSAMAGNVLPGTETSCTPPVSAARTPLKLLGARPAPLLRRSSFPASSLLEGADTQRRRLSIDSEDDSSPDTSRRRIRIIRRH